MRTFKYFRAIGSFAIAIALFAASGAHAPAADPQPSTPSAVPSASPAVAPTPYDPLGPLPSPDASATTPASPAPLLAAPKISLIRYCPAIKQVDSLERQAQDADAITQFDTARARRGTIALDYYHCAQILAKKTDLKSEYGHDFAMLLYAKSLKSSLPSNASAEAMQRVSSAVNDLVAKTKYADIHDQAAQIAQVLPTPAPTADPGACGSSGFQTALGDWKSAYNDYANSVNSTNQAGTMKATWLNAFIYSANQGAESGNVGKLNGAENSMSGALDAIRRSGMPQTAQAAEKVLAAVHTVNGYANTFTANGHRGITGVTDRNNIVAARLAVDNAAEEMNSVYCKS